MTANFVGLEHRILLHTCLAIPIPRNRQKLARCELATSFFYYRDKSGTYSMNHVLVVRTFFLITISIETYHKSLQAICAGNTNLCWVLVKIGIPIHHGHDDRCGVRSSLAQLVLYELCDPNLVRCSISQITERFN